MIDLCFSHIEALLTAMGHKRVFTDPSDLQDITAPVAALVYQDGPSELTATGGLRVAQADDLVNRTRTNRHQLYSEKLQLIVVLTDRSRAAVDARKLDFLRRLGSSSLKDADGNAIQVAAVSALLVEDKSILNGRAVAMEVTVEFLGGVYVDRTVSLYAGAQITPEPENQ